MKALLAASSSESFSGASKCLLELANGLRSNGVQVIVLLPNHGSIETLLRQKNITYYVIRQYQVWCISIDNKYPNWYTKIKQIANRSAVNAIKKLIRTHHIDIVHENASTAYAAALAAEECRIPVVWHLREFMEEDLGITFFDARYSIRIMNKATMAIAISQAVKDKWSQQLHIPIQVIHDGLPIDEYYIEREYAPCDKLNILIYGRIVPQKGQLFFFQAIEKYVESYGSEKIQCSWAGIVEDQNYYNSIISFQHDHAMESYCTYLGEISNIRKTLKNTNVVAVCSEMEGFGRVTVESMLAGTIVIGADTGATTELIHDGYNGYLYRNHDIDSFVEKLHQIDENQQDALHVAKTGQDRAITEFSLEQDINQVIWTYKELIGE